MHWFIALYSDVNQKWQTLKQEPLLLYYLDHLDVTCKLGSFTHSSHFYAIQ